LLEQRKVKTSVIRQRFEFGIASMAAAAIKEKDWARLVALTKKNPRSKHNIESALQRTLTSQR
jgi:hypothetical protein